MKKIVTILAFILSIPLLFSEIEQQKGIELETSFGTETGVIPLGTKGFIHTEENAFEGFTKRDVTFTRYNSSFEKIWQRVYTLKTTLSFQNRYVTKDALFLSFRSSTSGKYLIVKIDLESGKEKRFEGKYLPTAQELALKVLGDYIYAVYAKTTTLTLLIMNHKSSEQESHQLIKKFGTEFNHLTIHKELKKVSVSFLNSKKKSLNFVICNDKGAIIDRYSMPDRYENYRMRSAKLNFVNGRDSIVIGVYSEKKKGRTQGLYTASLEEGSLANIKYHSFHKFDNFFTYLPEFMQEMKKKSKGRKESKGKELKFSFNFLEHDLIANENGYIWVGESYYPTFRYETQTRMVNGQMVTVTVRVFDGWIFSHSVVASFDWEGNKLWDNCFDMGDFKTFNLREYVEVNARDNRVELLYTVRQKIRALEIVDGEVAGNKVYLDITSLDDELLFRPTSSNIEYWYDNYFICYGTTRVKDKGSKKKKGVFFINKVGYNAE